MPGRPDDVRSSGDQRTFRLGAPKSVFDPKRN
jgi:hypothetical protein